MLSPLSKEFVKVPVTVVMNGVTYDPHNDVIQMAFPVRGIGPAAGDWKPASWESDGSGGWLARCLVGPGGDVALNPGTYAIWLRIVDSPEVPIRKCGVVEIG